MLKNFEYQRHASFQQVRDKGGRTAIDIVKKAQASMDYIAGIICVVVIIVLSVFLPYNFFTNGNLNIDVVDTFLSRFMGIGMALWVIIYLAFQGLVNTFMYLKGSREFFYQDFGLGLVTENYRDLRVVLFELIPLFVPFMLLYYKKQLTMNILKQHRRNIQNGMSVTDANDQLLQNYKDQLGREDTIIQTIPLILFGVGVVFESKKFYHTRFLLGGVFFGTGIPMMINSLMVDNTDLGQLIIIEAVQYMFIVYGITMIIQSLLKYYLFTKKNKQQQEPRPPKITAESFDDIVDDCRVEHQVTHL